MELLDLWHYPRPALARSYLALLNTGVVATTTIFAPRRTGKTRFLQRDLTPAAEKAGFRVVYVDLWQTPAPGAALVAALQEALEPRSAVDKVVQRLKTPVKTLKASAELGGSKVEGTVELEGTKAPSETALQLDTLVGQLTKKQPLLLLVDEAQTLARSAAGEDVARALRTTLTRHAARLRIVFTGSSRTRLGHVFSNASAPLYSAGTGIQDFPLLDEAFVGYVLKRFKESTGRELDREVATRAFAGFDHRPEPFLHAILMVMLDPKLSLKAAVARVSETQARQENHEGTWQSLDALERALVRRAAENAALKPFTAVVLQQLRRTTGVDTLQATHVQKALARLADKNVMVRTPRGVFEFENERFAEWVKNIAE